MDKGEEEVMECAINDLRMFGIRGRGDAEPLHLNSTNGMKRVLLGCRQFMSGLRMEEEKEITFVESRGERNRRTKVPSRWVYRNIHW